MGYDEFIPGSGLRPRKYGDNVDELLVTPIIKRIL